MQTWWILRVVLANTVWDMTLCACEPTLENTMCLICFSWDTCFGDKVTMLWGSQADHDVAQRGRAESSTQTPTEILTDSQAAPASQRFETSGRQVSQMTVQILCICLLVQRAELSHFHASLTKSQFVRKQMAVVLATNRIINREWCVL